MSIEIGYTPAGDLLVRCGQEELIWPLANLQHAPPAKGPPSPSPAPPAHYPAPAPAPSVADPVTGPPPARLPAPPWRPSWPKPTPGIMTIIAGHGARHEGPVAWPEDWELQAPLAVTVAELQGLQPHQWPQLRQRIQLATRSAPALHYLTVSVDPDSLQGPLDVASLQQLADDESLGLAGVRLVFGPPSGEPL